MTDSTIHSIPEFGFVLVPDPDGTHFLGGEPPTRQNLSCPNCAKRLLHVLHLNCKVNALEQLDVDSVDLFFCWTCNLSHGFCYSLVDATLIDFEPGGRPSDFPYPDYPEAFANVRVRADPLSPELQARIRLHNALCRSDLPLGDTIWENEEEGKLLLPRHQLGGEPFMWDCLIDPACPRCHRALNFLAAVANDIGDPRGLVGDPSVQLLFFICIRCKVICARQDCD